MGISQSEVERLFSAGEFSELLRVSDFGPETHVESSPARASS